MTDTKHEAPAEDPVPAEWTGQGTDDDFFTPAKTAFSEEAPAEGAGEDAAWMWLNGHVECDPADRDYSADEMVDAFMAGQSAALRARSSAPEAREGEAPFGYWVDHKAANSPVFIRYGSFVPASDHYTITKLYTHPAAPSADKLRLAVEALESAREDLLRFACARGSEWEGSLEELTEEVDQALASLEVEAG